jgi:uncharacterized protein YlxW (UPF0749 family)
MMKTPESLKPHSKDYVFYSWEDYSFLELGAWVHLLCKRATHRTNGEKRNKDLYDAQNYLNMMQEHINHLQEHINHLKEHINHLKEEGNK